ncbi:hypothetical protein [Bacillus phage BM-P1]|nr:hypothetical protein [Bacillus phage BM-P1]
MVCVLVITAVYVLVGVTVAYAISTYMLVLLNMKAKGKKLSKTDQELLEGTDEKNWLLMLYLIITCFWLPLVINAIYKMSKGEK